MAAGPHVHVTRALREARKYSRRLNPQGQWYEMGASALPWLLGAGAVVGVGALIYSGSKASAATPPSPAPAPPPASTLSPAVPPKPSSPMAPAVPPIVAPPSLPASPPTSALTWPAGSLPWDPPISLPSPASSSATQTTDDPAWVMMAQSTLLAVSGSTSPVSVTYKGPIDGTYNASLTAALSAWQAYVISLLKAGGEITGTAVGAPNGHVDFKTLAVVMTVAMQMYTAGGGTVSAGSTRDPNLQSMALASLQNALNINTATSGAAVATVYGQLTKGITSVSLPALQTFEANLSSAIGSAGASLLPSSDAATIAMGALPLNVWASIVALAG